MAKRKILFISGTRADFGKLRPLIQKLDEEPEFEYSIFATGMHSLSRYGFTADEIFKAFGSRRLEKGFRNIHIYMNQIQGETMDLALANTMFGLSRYVNEYQPDMVIVHGDRVEALAGALVGSLRNILVAHIEGGELSGTIDELVRHAISKMAHLHFTANHEAKQRLIQLGEREETIVVLGSPDIDLMLSDELPSIAAAREYYDIPFTSHAIVMQHPITTDTAATRKEAKALVDAMLAAPDNFIVIYPNNDLGSDFILNEFERLKNHPRFVIYPSLRVTHFLTLLKHSTFLVGNSSAGIRETPIYGLPSVNIGSRQARRFTCPSIINVQGNKEDILAAMKMARSGPSFHPIFHFGHGKSANMFLELLRKDSLWHTPRQKQFMDVIAGSSEVEALTTLPHSLTTTAKLAFKGATV